MILGTTPQTIIANVVKEVEEAVRDLETSNLPIVKQPRLGAYQAAQGLSAAVSQLIERGQHGSEKITAISPAVAQHLHSLVNHTKVLAAVHSGQLKQSIPDLIMAVKHACEVMIDVTKHNASGETRNEVPVGLFQHLSTVVEALVNECNTNAADMGTTDISQSIISSSQLISALHADSVESPTSTESLQRLADGVSALLTITATVPTKFEYIHIERSSFFLEGY